MNEYKALNLFTDGKTQYLPNAPVAITGNKLFKRNDGDIYAAFEFKSLEEKRIIALKISIKAFDIEGQEIEGIDEYSYLDLSISYGETFGNNIFVKLPDSNTRDYKAKITLVV